MMIAKNGFISNVVQKLMVVIIFGIMLLTITAITYLISLLIKAI